MDDDPTDLMDALRYADAIHDAQVRYMQGLWRASSEYAKQLELLRIGYDADIAQALEQRGW